MSTPITTAKTPTSTLAVNQGEVPLPPLLVAIDEDVTTVVELVTEGAEEEMLVLAAEEVTLVVADEVGT